MLHAFTSETRRHTQGQPPGKSAGSPAVRPPTARPGPLAAMQAAYGNQAVLRFLQASSRSSGEGGASAVLQGKCACGSGGGGGDCAECKKKETDLQRKPVSSSKSGSGVPPIVHDVLRSPGQPLEAQTRAFFEPRFGHEFGNVRVHDDAKAATSADAVNALAYTVGPHIVFNSTRYQRDSPSGRLLLAHELAHVTQQNAAASGMLQRQQGQTAGSPSPGAVSAPTGHGVGASLCAAHSNELYYKTNPGYCQDTSSSGSLHSGFRCYREIPTGSGCPAGKHVCFDATTGVCDPGQSHIDDTAPSMSRTSTGMCDLSWFGLCSIEHFFADVIPGLWGEAAEAQISCIDNCQKTQSVWLQGFCMQGCTGGGAF
jgi:hypothetical protein